LVTEKEKEKNVVCYSLTFYQFSFFANKRNAAKARELANPCLTRTRIHAQSYFGLPEIDLN
jgi:hypothetical protein